MLNKLLLSTAILCVSATAGLAQGFSGAEIGIEYSDLTDLEDFSGTNYYGSAEFDIMQGVAVAGDFAIYDFELGDADISNFTLHGIYNLNPTTSLGLFFGQDNVDDSTVDNIGFEAAYNFGYGTAQGYIGQGDDGSDQVTYIGAAGDYGLGSGFSVTAAFDSADLDDATISKFEFGGEYALPAGVKFSAAIGNLSLDDSGVDVDENYFSIGASIGLGPKNGTTFNRRSFFEANSIGVDS
ncbi:hypothetical protein ACJ5NV_09490 [Loktanella agnita]|uniref:hypothetical protein n=1 Tax=Loktanella agnita TaxID=287097 RepID=UPI003985938A